MRKKCRVCGAEYESCYSCEKANSWRTLTDTLDHYYVLTVLMTYKTDKDAVKAYRALKKRGVDFDGEDCLPGIRDLLAEIYLLGAESGKQKSRKPDLSAETEGGVPTHTETKAESVQAVSAVLVQPAVQPGGVLTGRGEADSRSEQND